MFSHTTAMTGHTLQVTPIGRLDHEATGGFRDKLRLAVADYRPRLVLLDMDGITFIDSSGLGLLVALRNSVDKVGGTLRICGLQPQVRKTFTQTNLMHYFQVFGTAGDALIAPLPGDPE